MGIDVGKARIGISRSDLHGMLATPVETVQRDLEGSADIERIVELIEEINVFECIVGLPMNMQGERTLSTDDAENFAQRLAAAIHLRKIPVAPASVRLIDERLSTVSAQGQLRQAGRNTKNSRSIIDQAAAVVILQHALDSERAQNVPPGTEIVIELNEAESDPEHVERAAESHV